MEAKRQQVDMFAALQGDDDNESSAKSLEDMLDLNSNGTGGHAEGQGFPDSAPSIAGSPSGSTSPRFGGSW